MHTMYLSRVYKYTPFAYTGRCFLRTHSWDNHSSWSSTDSVSPPRRVLPPNTQKRNIWQFHSGTTVRNDPALENRRKDLGGAFTMSTLNKVPDETKPPRNISPERPSKRDKKQQTKQTPRLLAAPCRPVYWPQRFVKCGSSSR